MKSQFLIRPVGIVDAIDCFEVWQLSQGRSSYGVSLLEDLLQQQVNCVHVGAFTESRKQAIGWVTLGWVGRYGKLVSLFVHPQYRSAGLGRQLVRNVIDTAIDKSLAQVDLEVAIENNVARKLYKQSGFKQIGSSPHHQQYRCFLPE